MAGTVKAFNLPIDYVLYNLSYVNLIMYGATLPSYESKRDKNKNRSDAEQDVIKADDPRNRELVRKFFESIE